MAKLTIPKDSTSRIEYVFIRDSSLSTGLGLTGLVFNTASLAASYARAGAARVAITLATQTVTGGFSSGGFVEVDATNMPGLYRFDPPDAAFATGVDHVVIMLKGASNMEPVLLEYQLGIDVNTTQVGGATPQTVSDVTTAIKALATTGASVGTVGAALDLLNVNFTALRAANLDNISEDTQTACELAIDGKVDDIALNNWNYVVDDSVTAAEMMRGITAFALGILSGAGTATNVFMSIGNIKARVTATVDADGNRTAIVLDLTP